MQKISQTITFFMIISILLLPLGGHTVSANTLMDEITSRFEYLIHYVKPGGSGDCLSWATACDLQTALSKIPDQIWVAAGVYTPTTTSDREVSFELESGVKIFGGFPAEGGEWETRDWQTNTTTLSGDIGIEGDATDNSYHVVSADGVNRLAVLDGFTITGGYADGYIVPDDPNSSGAGMYNLNSSPTLVNLNFIENTAKWGAGMYNEQSSPELTNVTFSGNILILGGEGAGMYNLNQSSPKLTEVTFSSNIGFYEGGGAMANENQSSPTLKNVTFTDNLGGGMVNQADSNPMLSNVIFSGNSSMIGGGMYNQQSSPTLTDVVFNENDGSRGGGMYNILSNPILNNVTFSGNTTSDYPANFFIGIGGGIANIYKSSPTLTNVTFSGNSASAYGGGMYNTDQCHPQLTNVTFWGNTANISGGGIANTFDFNNASPSFSNPILTNVILWGNVAPDDAGILSDFGEPQISYSDIQGCGGSSSWNSSCGVDGGNNIEADPLLGPLVDNGGFTLTHALLEGSPAIDAGDPNTCPETDQRGVARPQGDYCDMGADEYEFPDELNDIFLPLILQ
ncbi:MAG TPA: choice-of-anchor Q domain-containing protein [Brevefilum sp.]